MAQERTFKLPDVGEGLTEAEIVQWRVKAGDEVAVNDVIVEIETAKSLVELPSPYAGVVGRLLVSEGETVGVGAEIVAIAVPGDGERPASNNDENRGLEAARSLQEKPGKPVEVAANGGDADGSEPQALVGSGPKPDPVQRRRKSTVSRGGKEALSTTFAYILAKPPVRKKAKDMGIDLMEVQATGAEGQVTYEDLARYLSSKPLVDSKSSSLAAPVGTSMHTFWAASGKERIERIPVKGVRKATAQSMVSSAFSAPHVSIFVDVDASRTMEFVKRLKSSRDFEGIKVSPLLILAKAVIWAAARNPAVNATWTDDEILVHHYMNLGIAAATPRGLLVPNIKNAHELSVKELAVALNALTVTARAGKTQPAQMQGGTLTITNIGALGIDTGTPIINPGEVAIVAFGTIKQKPWVLDGEVIPRWITTLGGSFDHRVVDGDLSARFMADVAAILEEPALLLE